MQTQHTKTKSPSGSDFVNTQPLPQKVRGLLNPTPLHPRVHARGIQRGFNKVSVTALHRSFKVLCPMLQHRARRALFYLGLSGVYLEIYLISSVAMRKLNKTFRKKNKVTDVLSFEMPKPFILPKLPLRPIGQIYLAPKYIKRHIGKNHADINFLLVHGLLHLLGYDHVRKGDMIKMQRKEEFLMTKLKIPTDYY